MTRLSFVIVVVLPWCSDAAKAREAYRQAIQRYKESKLPNDSQLLIRRNVERVEARLELLERSALKSARLKDGTYTGTAFGYSDNILARVTAERGRIADIQIEHKERADLGNHRARSNDFRDRGSKIVFFDPAKGDNETAEVYWWDGRQLVDSAGKAANPKNGKAYGASPLEPDEEANHPPSPILLNTDRC